MSQQPFLKRKLDSVRNLAKYTAFRLTLSLLISIIAIVFILSFVSYRDSVQILEEETSESSLQTIVQTNRHIDNMLRQYTDFAQLLANDQSFLNMLTMFSYATDQQDYDDAESRITNLLESLLASNRIVSSITLFSPDQNRIVSSLRRESLYPIIRGDNAAAVRQTEWFKDILNSDKDLTILDTRRDAFVNSHAEEPMFAVAHQIRGTYGQKLLGTLVIEVSTSHLKSALDGFKLGMNGGYAVVNVDGKMIYSNNEQLIETSYTGAMPMVNGTASQGASGNFNAYDGQGIMQNYTYQHSELSNWYLIGFYPSDELHAPMRRMLWNSIWISLMFCVLAAFCVGFLVHRSVGRPLHKLRMLMQEGEQGNLGVRTDFQVASEIGDLGRAFNRMMEQISLAYYDTLTNLPNRRLLVDRMGEALPQATENGTQVGVLFVDLDRFKIVNDTLGHQAGDLLIQIVGQRLQQCTGVSDTVARIAGDEFVVILPGSDAAQSARTAERMLETIREPFLIFDQELHVTGSIGIAIYPQDAKSAETLLRCADIAMYEAKAKGKNMAWRYDPDMAVRKNERMRIENDLYRALENEEFELYYQPRVDATTRAIVGSEALIRWNHPSMGRVPPDKFIPIAEETGFIVPLGEWVLRAACKQNKIWQNQGYPAMRIAVNVSARQLQFGFLEQVADILQETGLSGEWLEIEITERVLLDNDKMINETLRGLKANQIHLSIDDFGTGYSSLAFLKEFEVDTLKLDRSFVRDIPFHPDNQTIATAVIQLAHNLGMTVTAEGVETEQEYAFLHGLGSDEMQGYYFSKPLPADDYMLLMEANKTPFSQD